MNIKFLVNKKESQHFFKLLNMLNNSCCSALLNILGSKIANCVLGYVKYPESEMLHYGNFKTTTFLDY